VECSKYLPPSENCTIYWLKDIVAGVKKALDGQNITHLNCPQYESLTTEIILTWARQQNSSLPVYLPDEKDIAHLPKQWLVNIIYANLGAAFKDFIKAKVEARNQKIAEDRKMMIDVDPDIAQAFDNTNHVSISKGKGAHLLKQGSKVSVPDPFFISFLPIETALQG
jgi:hypothetical protein